MDLSFGNWTRCLVAGLWIFGVGLTGCGPADGRAGADGEGERGGDLAPAVEAVQARRGALPL
ncbi:MAG TPA: hypothetical protein VHN15_04460, partial [Thermoanaerobaculia bacterium]|nr:hypothetical protein [Thermoanaerobaculia bacterium]